MFGAFGTWLGGVIADRAAKRDLRAYMSVPAGAAILAGPLFFAALLTPSAAWALGLLAIPILLNSLWYGPVFASVQSLVQPRTRATAAALLLFVVNLIGLGLGPLFVGALSDALAVKIGPAEGVRWAMICSASVGFVAAGAYMMARRTLREEIVS